MLCSIHPKSYFRTFHKEVLSKLWLNKSNCELWNKWERSPQVECKTWLQIGMQNVMPEIFYLFSNSLGSLGHLSRLTQPYLGMPGILNAVWSIITSLFFAKGPVFARDKTPFPHLQKEAQDVFLKKIPPFWLFSLCVSWDQCEVNVKAQDWRNMELFPWVGGRFIKAHVWSRKLKNKADF